MSWWTTILVALVTGGLGLVCGGVVAGLGTRWHSVSDNAGRAYSVIYGALFGGLISLIAGIVISRLVAAWDHPGFFQALGTSCVLVLTIHLAALLICRWTAHIPPCLGGRTLLLEVELKLPAGQSLPPPACPDSPSFSLSSVIRRVQRKKETGDVHLHEARQEGTRWIVPASAFLFTRKGWRCIDMRLGGESVGTFIIPLPARPGARHENWSSWGPRGRNGEEWPDSKSSYRFRVKRIAPEVTPA